MQHPKTENTPQKASLNPEAAETPAKRRFPCEAAFLIGMIGNSFSVALLAKSDMGLTTASLVSFVMNKVFSRISFGAWNYLIQCAFVVALAILVKRVKVGYVFSFVLAILFGNLVDLFTALLAPLPVLLPLRVLYYLLGTGILVTGIAFFNRCRMPILPIDTFVRDLSEHFRIRSKIVRTALDLSCLAAALLVGLLWLGGIPGVGVGTLISSFSVGVLSGRIADKIHKHLELEPLVPALNNLIEE